MKTDYKRIGRHFISITIAVFLHNVAYTQIPTNLLQGLVAYYPFTGNANDASGNGNNGTMTGAATLGVDRFGNSNQCLSLPGTAGVGSAVDVPSLSNMPYGPVTYSAWFRLNGYLPFPTANNNVMTLVGREQCGNGSDGAICLYSYLGSTPSESITNRVVYYTGASGYSGQLVPPTNQWCQVVLTIETNGAVNFYFNGTNVPGVGAAPAGQPLAFRIGASASGGCGGTGRYVWNGQIDDVRVYNRSLSGAEVQQLYAYEAPSEPPAIVSQPQSLTVSAGSNATFSVTADGTPPLYYQWSFNSSVLTNETNATLTLTGVTTNHAGPYAVRVSNAFGSTNSSNAVLTVTATPPFITSQPAEQAVVAGATATFTVGAGGTPPLYYQWSFNGSVLTNETNATLTLTGVTTNQAGPYAVRVSNMFDSVVSSNATLSILRIPTNLFQGLVAYYPFTGNAADASGNGNNGTMTGAATLGMDRFGNSNQCLSLPGAAGVGSAVDVPSLSSMAYLPVTYSAWIRLNGYMPFPSANNNVMVLVGREQCGDLYDGGICVYSYLGSTPSESVTNRLVYYTGASGYSTQLVPPTNQWCQVVLTIDQAGAVNFYFNGTNVPGVGAAPAGQPLGFRIGASATGGCGGTGRYTWNGQIDDVRIYNRALSGTEVQELYAYEGTLVASAPFLYSQPADQTVAVGATATFSVGAGGTLPLSYQWSFNDSVLTNETNATLTLTGVTTNQAGSYAVQVSNSLGSTNSTNAILTVNPVPPSIVTQPANRTVTVGSSATFTVLASGSLPLSYQWNFNASVLTNATNASLTLTNVQGSQAGNYWVQVGNAFGSTNSSNAVLTVTFPPAAVRVVSTNAVSGWPVSVPIALRANGNEKALGFSLTFSTQRLTYASVSLGSGAAGGSLLLNTNQAGSGSLGIAVDLPSGTTFATGTQDVVRVNFTSPVLLGSSPVGTTVSFADTPMLRQLSDVNAHTLPASYYSGTVTLSPSDLEGDVTPRPGGDRVASITDWVQLGRFVAGLDTPAAGGEFQRADCAPRATLGDGQIDVTDWVQAGRYAAGLDPLTAVGGPTSAVAQALADSKSPAVQKVKPLDISGTRTLSVGNVTAIGGLTTTLTVNLASQGDESALTFSLNFDPAAFQYAGVSLGSATAGATLCVNTNQLAGGKVGLALALPIGNSFPGGSCEIVKVSLVPASSVTGDYAAQFGDQPVSRGIADPCANKLTASYVAGTVTVNGLPQLTIAPSDGSVTITWPVWAAGFALQTCDGRSFSPGAWTNVVTALQTNGSHVEVTLPVSGDAQFFRLQHH